MNTKSHFRMTNIQRDCLRQHLLPGDGLEASAIVLASCSHIKENIIFLVKDITLIPHAECTRTVHHITWPGDYLEKAIEKGEDNNLSIFLIHSHPLGLEEFSEIDNESDDKVIPCLYQGYPQLHGSIIMTPQGNFCGRYYDKNFKPQYISKFLIVGDDIELYSQSSNYDCLPFSAQMTEKLKGFKIGVIGASGTGSIVIENLARLGVGHLVIVDDDVIEHKNLNRIINSTIESADRKMLKVSVLADAIHQYAAHTSVTPIPSKVEKIDTVLELASCDIVFSCVDTLLARMYADLIGEYFLLPIFDIGVAIPTKTIDGRKTIAEACIRLDYVQPHGNSLKDRNVYTSDMLQAEYLKNASPDSYEKQLREGYLKGVIEEAPSVITLNMLAASLCVNEFLARTFAIRQEHNRSYARTILCLGANEMDFYKEDHFKTSARKHLGSGITNPLLGMPDLGYIK